MQRSSKKTTSATGRRPKQETKAGALLRAAREKKGLTPQDVERMTGLSGGGIYHLENGRSVPKITTALILCEFYGLQMKELLAAVAEDEL